VLSATALAAAARASGANPADSGGEAEAELAQPAEPVEPVDPSDDGPVRPPTAIRRGATALGRAVHAVLQTVDLGPAGDDTDAVAALAAVYSGAEGIPDAAPDVARRARAALFAPSVEAARRARRRWRELYVAAPVGVEGRM